ASGNRQRAGYRSGLAVTPLAQGAPDGNGIEAQHLAHTQEGERPRLVLAAQPALRFPKDLTCFRAFGRGRLGIDGDGVLQNSCHQPLLAGPPASSPLTEELDGQDGVRLQELPAAFLTLTAESVHARLPARGRADHVPACRALKRSNSDHR